MKDYSDDSTWKQFYKEKEAFLAERYEKVSAVDFYSDIFGDYINTNVSNFMFSQDTKPEDRRGKPIVRYFGEISDYNEYKDKLIRDNKHNLELELEQAYNNALTELADMGFETGALEDFDVNRVDDNDPIVVKYKIELENELDNLAKFYQTGQYQRYTGIPNEYSERGTKVAAQTRSMIDRCVEADLGLIKKMKGKKTAYMAPITYFNGKANAKNAHMLHAIAIDIDTMTPEHVTHLFRLFDMYNNSHKDRDYCLTPTYIVNSGHGIHLYYVLDKPIILYKYVQPLITKFKNELVRRFWAKNKTSLVGDIDNQVGVQPYRVVGSLTKLGEGYFVTAYRVGGKISFETLNNSAGVEPILKLPLESYRPRGISGHDLAYWKEADPDWYRRKIEGKPAKNKETKLRFPWLYQKMKDIMFTNSHVGNRWHCLTCLFSDAYLCGIPYEEVLEYAKVLMQFWNADFKPGEKDDTGRVVYFSEEDVLAASKFYGKSEKPMRLETLQKKTGYDFESLRNRRNGRSQAEHLKIARAINDALHPDGSWREGNGRPSAEDTVRKYLAEHPTARKSEIIKETGLSKPTVYKWYKIIKGESNDPSAT